jgi:hypothetical protein
MERLCRSSADLKPSVVADWLRGNRKRRRGEDSRPPNYTNLWVVSVHTRERGNDRSRCEGGEEFLLIMPNADAEATRVRMEQMRLDAKQLRIMHSGTPLGPITISAGIAASPIHGSSPKQILAAADVALYQAKKSGRDCIVVAEKRDQALPKPHGVAGG